MEPLEADAALRTVLLIWFATVGAVIGSFANVVIARVPHGRSVVRPRSACPRCGAAIAWYDNVPVVSWILLRARCRTCGEPISFRYPLVEALCAAAALAAAERHGLSLSAVAELVLVVVLLALAFIDLDTWLLPHALTWPLIALGLAANAARLAPAGGLASSAAGAVVGFAAFAAVALVGSRVFRREALGWGDVWLLAGIGAWLGARALLPVVLLASLQGSVFGVALILLGRGQPGPRAEQESAAGPPPQGTEPPPPAGDAPPPKADAPPPPADAPPVAGPAPAAAPAPGGEEDWVPPRNAVPFGPFLALGALEWLYLAAALARLVPALGGFR